MNKTITFLIGNGLGKSLDADHFDLKQGMKQGWGRTRSKKIKSLINKFLGKAAPTTENDLKKIQDCFLKLQSIECQIKDLPHGLKHHIEFNIKKDKERYFEYLFNVSSHFYNYPIDETPLPSKFATFMENFCLYIEKKCKDRNTVHVATLNYDGLLYKKFIEKGNIFKGYDGFLVDGITDAGFNKDNLKSRYGKNFGWYLHLHGSPLFYSDHKKIKKNTYNNNTSSFEEVSYKPGRRHIILCHPKQKYETIQYSEILSEYLEHFKVAITHTDYLVIIGYGGKDTHINEIIKSFLKKEGQIIVIERLEEGEFDERVRLWKDLLCAHDRKFKLIQKTTILDFNFECTTENEKTDPF